jgi:hypothetical protein
MKSLRTILPAATAILAVCILVPVAQAGISGSAHDFGNVAGGWSGNQICLPCHAPHNTMVRDANGALLGGPLWNHQLSEATYTLYINPDTGLEESGEVDTNSMLCLSCHDGTVALDSFGGATGTQFIGAAGNVGTDLSNDHPIGEAALWPTGATYMVDPALRDAAHIMPLRKLADGREAVGCTSCHEPHNRKNLDNMLWVKNDGQNTLVTGTTVSGSALCLNCHKK